MRRYMTLLGALAVQGTAMAADIDSARLAALEARFSALQSNVIGLFTVIILMMAIIIMFLGMMIYRMSTKPQAARRPAGAPAPVARPAEQPRAAAPVPTAAQPAAAVPGQIKPEIAAVITAAVTTFLAGRPFVIHGVHLQTDPAHMWGKLGRTQIQMSHALTRRR